MAPSNCASTARALAHSSRIAWTLATSSLNSASDSSVLLFRDLNCEALSSSRALSSSSAIWAVRSSAVSSSFRVPNCCMSNSNSLCTDAVDASSEASDRGSPFGASAADKPEADSAAELPGPSLSPAADLEVDAAMTDVDSGKPCPRSCGVDRAARSHGEPRGSSAGPRVVPLEFAAAQPALLGAISQGRTDDIDEPEASKEVAAVLVAVAVLREDAATFVSS
mmetsp:Transcript_69851/g.194238  ORF Transcript_69851/g.194238 Transcript_69851/m.194238 type:complete len:223 (-) Transcript_69851:1133-1801(-)